MHNIPEKKILSVGVYTTSSDPTQGRQGRNKESIIRESYRHALDADERVRLDSKAQIKNIESLHPLEVSTGRTRLKEQHEANILDGDIPYFAIGSQLDATGITLERRASQAHYLRQLEADAIMAAQIRAQEEMSPPKRTIQRRPPSPEISGEFNIGVASSYNEVRKKELAKEYYKQNQLEIARKNELKHQKSYEYDIDAKFGVGLQNDVGKMKMQEQKRAYTEALRKDINVRDTQRRADKQDDVYVNRTGWSGLNVGGTSSGNTASVQELSLKRNKQDSYRRSLDMQKHTAEILKQRMDEEDSAFDNLNVPPPYLESRNY